MIVYNFIDSLSQSLCLTWNPLPRPSAQQLFSSVLFRSVLLLACTTATTVLALMILVDSRSAPVKKMQQYTIIPTQQTLR